MLVVVGASLMLRPHRVAAIAERVHDHGACLLYDASHVAGLVAEGRFQAPLAEGADVMTFSTYKSFGRPAGGVIAAHDEALMARCAAAIYPGLTANYDIARLLPLGEAALERKLAAGAYADRCIANARALAAALAAEGLSVLGAEHGYASSHHVAVDCARSAAARSRRDGSPRATSCSPRSAVPRPTARIPQGRSGSARSRSPARASSRTTWLRSRRRSRAACASRAGELRAEVAAIRGRHRS